jgi:hypothetical protein
MRLPSGRVTLAYPPGWHRLAGDTGTVTAVQLGPDRRIVGYLNATPRDGRETLSNWARFRPAHNAEEGDRHVHRLAAAGALAFRDGRGSCVSDSYVTTTSASYREIACLIAGVHANVVVVGAARTSDWTRRAPAIEQAIASVET